MRKILLVLVLVIVNSSLFATELGKKTYQIACKNCHDPDLSKAINAPAAFDKQAWNSRFEQASMEAKNNPEKYKSAIDYLLYNVTIGKKLMYHGGLCKESHVKNKDCSDKALIEAIYYMSQR